MYVIKAIRDRSGNDRIDGRYPLRIGRRCLVKATTEYPALFKYVPRENETYEGVLRTSNVQDIVIQDDAVIIATLNSIYMLELER